MIKKFNPSDKILPKVKMFRTTYNICVIDAKSYTRLYTLPLVSTGQAPPPSYAEAISWATDDDRSGAQGSQQVGTIE